MCSSAGCSRLLCLTLSLAGLLLSLYSLHVKTQAEKDENYVALCDISEGMSCSKVFSSPYSKGFGLVGPYLGEEHPANQSNSVYGLAFYSTLLLLSLFNYRFLATLQMVLSVGAIGMSCYLAYILHFVLENFCVVCVSTYVVNFLLFFTSWCKRCSLGKKVKEDKYGYTIPTSLNNNRGRDGFKKFI